MTTTLLNIASSYLKLPDVIEYPEAGILSKVVLQDDCCKYTLFCLAANTGISEHTAVRNATISVLEGKGTLTLEGEEIELETGVFVVMPAHAPHSLKAQTNLAFLLTLSA
ncbi:MAG: cupin domain-containing protein [Roseofilum sp. SBFL]|uniref:cupin domain-containing protein n=1 Tax=unclassified Roseofilum TaxID=2620099 RepID=UPI001B2175D0|nr:MULTISPECIES: cupin domain-containing protein [unclassified Roseofilum]MBP0012671.1 cupin domain-containing protein [Roseofilum sp. SID3]MBP0023175.1 cupin domain-containing protein [Roseofilum sp. SID2]MBP0039981.1 cupin domain-containing protein [Roseofilum sp. SID1]MBP0042326.1 cupin domain-containing protein [Roseofilum sp. SBFL]